MIRIAHPGDLPAINRIYNQAVRERFATAHLDPLEMEDRRRWFAAHPPDRYPVFVFERDGAVQGWVSLGPYRQDRQALAHVGEVSYYVEKSSRRTGIGKQLLQHAIGVAPGVGIEILVAILLDRNRASIALLRQSGFQEWGRMPSIARIGQESADHLYLGLKL